VCFIYFAREAAGASMHPAFPAPSVHEGNALAKPGHIALREREDVSEERRRVFDSFRHSGARVSANYGAQLRT
jgi:hypothetical protein